MRITECSSCGRMFDDIDNTGVCPNGHENAWTADDDEYPIGQVTI